MECQEYEKEIETLKTKLKAVQESRDRWIHLSCKLATKKGYNQGDKYD